MKEVSLGKRFVLEKGSSWKGAHLGKGLVLERIREERIREERNVRGKKCEKKEM